MRKHVVKYGSIAVVAVFAISAMSMPVTASFGEFNITLPLVGYAAPAAILVLLLALKA